MVLTVLAYYYSFYDVMYDIIIYIFIYLLFNKNTCTKKNPDKLFIENIGSLGKFWYIPTETQEDKEFK